MTSEGETERQNNYDGCSMALILPPLPSPRNTIRAMGNQTSRISLRPVRRFTDKRRYNSQYNIYQCPDPRRQRGTRKDYYYLISDKTSTSAWTEKKKDEWQR